MSVLAGVCTSSLENDFKALISIDVLMRSGRAKRVSHFNVLTLCHCLANVLLTKVER